ncbi:AraC family transcriptional regulator [Sinorhizobium garamanticum]|uniref:AraC family transcriptional regulator n=1 Tax=Sinorhizobium garamanticum TaxID=680247 RepID=A0ABY8DMN9_9HYPH|nr:AraC family transcriptional regulator [Sinorhizobium garamanticum]WEX91257.1 AraC family transcriptional regulator [Sinorhizobium garamanticum]
MPFVVSLVLCLILVRMIRQEGWKLGLFPLLVATFAIQAVLSGLNWNIGWYPARFIQPILAALLPALSFAAFDQLRRNNVAKFSGLWLHLIPASVVAGLVAFWRAPIDLVLFATCLGYGLALLRVARQGPGALAAARISDEWTAHKALVAMAALLVLTAFIDATISLDFFLGEGQRAQTLLTVASVLWLAVAGYAATVADDARPHMGSNATEEIFAVATSGPRSLPSASSTEEDAAIIDRIDTLMREQHLYRDADLTLERLARRAGIPARQISGALNRVHGRNVSQVVNEYRVGDAKRRLIATPDPVTVIMLESGFGTKSNFNREFLRITGMTPSAYRRADGETPAASKAQTEVPASS